MVCSGVTQSGYDVAQAFWVAGVQLGSPLRQLAKSLIFCRSESVQPLLLNAWTHWFLSNVIVGKVPQAAYLLPRLVIALPRLSQVAELEFELPHPAARSSKVAPRAIRRIGVLPFSPMADAIEETTSEPPRPTTKCERERGPHEAGHHRGLRFKGEQSFRLSRSRCSQGTTGLPIESVREAGVGTTACRGGPGGSTRNERT